MKRSAALISLVIGIVFLFMSGCTNPIQNSGSSATTTATTTTTRASLNAGTLVKVSGGTFTLQAGGPNMTVSTFLMSPNLITRAQFLNVMGSDPSVTKFSSGTSDPVQNINWYMAIAFCNKLSLLEGLTPAYSVATVSNWSTLAFSSIPYLDNSAWDEATLNPNANGYRLPTEMQYMWAAMGGLSDALKGDVSSGINILGYNKGYAGSLEPNGGQTNIGNYAWYASNSANSTHPVATKLGNELGIYDLTGNVYEWCWDLYGQYPSSSMTDYLGPSTGINRVLRSGSWYDSASNCSVASRYTFSPSLQNEDIGFRVVLP